MSHPVDERYETLSARVRDALRNRQHVRDVMTDEELEELEERRQAYLAAVKLYHEELRESIRIKREELKRKVLEQAERDGVDLPGEVAEDYSPTGKAVRYQFYRDTYPEGHYSLDLNSMQKRWFAHPEFDRVEYDRLCTLYNLSPST